MAKKQNPNDVVVQKFHIQGLRDKMDDPVALKQIVNVFTRCYLGLNNTVKLGGNKNGEAQTKDK